MPQRAAEILAAPAEAPPADAWDDAAWCEGCDLGFNSLKAAEEHEAGCPAYLERFERHH